MTSAKGGIPLIALSVRQPWAWAIIHAGKDIENRSAPAVNHGLKAKGRIAIHAAKGMTKAEYEQAAAFMASIDIICPRSEALLRGGIIGSVDVIDVVKESASPWFFGPRGLVLKSPLACDFIPARGSLGYFRWQESRVVTDTPKWMRDYPGTPGKAAAPASEKATAQASLQF